jgi:hypothetical protein
MKFIHSSQRHPGLRIDPNAGANRDEGLGTDEEQPRPPWAYLNDRQHERAYSAEAAAMDGESLEPDPQIEEEKQFERETFRDETPEWAQGIRADY